MLTHRSVLIVGSPEAFSPTIQARLWLDPTITELDHAHSVRYALTIVRARGTRDIMAIEAPYLPGATELRELVSHARHLVVLGGRHSTAGQTNPAIDEERLAHELGLPDVDRATVLSTRERQVVRLLATGRDGRQVAAQLNVSYDTVRSHQQHIYRKLRATTAAHAVAICLSAGLI